MKDNQPLIHEGEVKTKDGKVRGGGWSIASCRLTTWQDHYIYLFAHVFILTKDHKKKGHDAKRTVVGRVSVLLLY